MERDWSAARVCAHAGISHRNLNYWINAGIIDLPDRRMVGSGYHRRFTPYEAAAIRVLAFKKRALDRQLAEWSSGALWHQLTEQRVA